ncbi:MAG: endonuclease/exonuclease/phosphatase family protein [Pseudomonadota bacterium]|nr:endonuclease/exonuclease/phosphatase family protein [Pseudomonadota bacterium]
MRIATFNVYWFGTTRPGIVDRTPDDDDLVARVLAGLDADVLALQEICDLPRLERVLRRAATFSGRDRHLRVGDSFVTSARPSELADTANQKVVCAWDPATVEPLAWGALGGGPALRPPLLATFRDRRDGAALTLAALHLKSGFMGAPLTDESAALRLREAAYLARWLSGENVGPTALAQAPLGPLVALGDMNARRDDPTLEPLRRLPGWSWPVPTLPAEDPWTTFLDREVIDHIGASPAARFVGTPYAYAFDRDPALGGRAWFHAVEDFSAQRARGFPRAPVENLYRVSDHRPVVAEIEPV